MGEQGVGGKRWVGGKTRGQGGAVRPHMKGLCPPFRHRKPSIQHLPPMKYQFAPLTFSLENPWFVWITTYTLPHAVLLIEKAL